MIVETVSKASTVCQVIYVTARFDPGLHRVSIQNYSTVIVSVWSEPLTPCFDILGIVLTKATLLHSLQALFIYQSIRRPHLASNYINISSSLPTCRGLKFYVSRHLRFPSTVQSREKAQSSTMALGSYKPSQQCGNNYCKKYLLPPTHYPQVFGTYFPYLPGTSFTMLISELLSEASIANVYWGTGAWFVLGLPKVGEDTQFIIADGLLDAAASTITAKAYIPVCPAGHDCPIMKGRNGAVPDLHFHINHYDACLTLDLFGKSRLVPALPELRLDVPAFDDPTFTLASSFQWKVGVREKGRIAASGPGRFGSRCTPFSEDGPAVQILTPAAAVDALVYLCLRHFGKGAHWITWADGLFGLGVLYSDAVCEQPVSRDVKSGYKHDYVVAYAVASNGILVEK